ncbi:hypothetical protein HK096_000063 [Nowakowskiella sp. JEL0078]|nr:hypothetical protein HK096_000063 [Nowakowskiella sp. JEL0078]
MAKWKVTSFCVDNSKQIGCIWWLDHLSTKIILRTRIITIFAFNFFFKQRI